MAFLTTVEEVHRTRGAGFDVKRCVGLTSMDSENLLQLVTVEESESLRRQNVLLEAEIEKLRNDRRNDALKIIEEKKRYKGLEREASLQVEREKSSCDEKMRNVWETVNQWFTTMEVQLAEIRHELAETKREPNEVTARSDALELQLAKEAATGDAFER